MLQLVTIKSSIDYINLFKKILELNPEDNIPAQLINKINNIENGCRCKRTQRYNVAKDSVSFYISNLNEDIKNKLKNAYDAEEIKFEILS